MILFPGVLLLGITAAVPPSPAIESLMEGIKLRGAAAEEPFWKEVVRRGGTPLVDCPSAIAPDCLVTFLWRGDASTRNVVAVGEALPGQPTEHMLARVPATGVWYRTYRFRNDARFMYMLSIDDPLTSWDVEGPARRERYAGVRTDPLNQRKQCYVSLPRAPSERWAEQRPGVARGTIQRHKIGERTVDLYASPGLRPGTVSPVLVLFDGDEARDLLSAPVILDNLRAERRIPPLAAVFVSQRYERREADLCCSRETNRFLAKELVPWVRAQCGIRTSPERTIAAGASLGGLAAAFAALEHPETFGRVLSQSGAFWWGPADTHEWLTAEVRSRPRVNARFYLDVGLMEGGGELSQLETNRRFRDALRAKGYKPVYREFNGTHAMPCWRAGFADALTALLSK